jgi:hypothetical protein
MNTKKKPIYDPSCDEDILSIAGHPNEEGDLLDIDENLYLSRKAGFYLHRQIRQIRRGRTWETAGLYDCDGRHDPQNIRILKVIRPMTPTQVIRYIIDAYMPREGGLHLATHLALDSAGIPSS